MVVAIVHHPTVNVIATLPRHRGSKSKWLVHHHTGTGHLTFVPVIISDLIAVMFCSGVNLLLAIVLFSTIVGEMLPVTNNTPLIGHLYFTLLIRIYLKWLHKMFFPGTYFNCIMFMVASSVVTTIMVLNYHHRIVDTHEMPDWVKSLFLQWLPWLLRMSRYITAS